MVSGARRMEVLELAMPREKQMMRGRKNAAQQRASPPSVGAAPRRPDPGSPLYSFLDCRKTGVSYSRWGARLAGWLVRWCAGSPRWPAWRRREGAPYAAPRGNDVPAPSGAIGWMSASVRDPHAARRVSPRARPQGQLVRCAHAHAPVLRLWLLALAVHAHACATRWCWYLCSLSCSCSGR